MEVRESLRIYIMGNGMVMVFDGNGEQIPALQGTVGQAIPEIIDWLWGVWSR